ncbi:GyrI-like domain-containing protein [Paenibacillus sp. YPG26]|uniref:GyrI-like domain-containing protein n=1 Tax=Paenibacillus sp. YPG26 TaxID=2878915 RepID=UPI00203D54CA|nr:GyrI-like domain-containing protein [Paenibacillus sp. YPG26]USB33084.1 GyrI-like domain-containing protein [Paenibacillus sp. YPG26]
MSQAYTNGSELRLAGITCRTTNSQEAGPNGQIPGLWEAYFKEAIADRIHTEQPHLIYALYTDYESDASGAYTLLIGHELNGSEAADLSGLEVAVVPASKYKVFTTNRGPVYEVVAEAWGRIWSYFRDAEEQRAYTGDYELYDARNMNPEDAVVQIYIAVK